MERQAQKKISYVLPLAQDGPAGHRLGVSGLSYDHGNHLLYSGGRDGIIFAWQTRPVNSDETQCLAHYQTHTHWINDLALVHKNQAIVSASSDTTVKLWRPFAASTSPPHTLGFHGDYVKAVTSPSQTADWVASGSLDHHIGIWDINEGRERQRIRVTEQGSAKGSVYALTAKQSMIASGGPENIVKLWDPRSGKRISQLIGHTDNIRSILMSSGYTQDTIVTASADRTVKVWSVSAGRCLYSLAMHNDSVWSLYSNDPDLDVFYSADRSGLVVKTDAREKHDIDQGFSIGICQENEGINRIVVADEDIWVATANSSLNRWHDANNHAKLQRLEDVKAPHRSSIAGTTRTKNSVTSLPTTPPASGGFPRAEVIPLTCALRIPELPGSLAAPFRNRMRQSALSRRRASLASIDTELGTFIPLRSVPVESIEGQNGLVKHMVLNNKRHVLTADSAGEVLLWDLLQCVPIRSFGKAHLDVIYKQLNTPESIPQWCEIDTRTGTLACTLDHDHCFAAEIYVDELREFGLTKVRADQRISLGAWVLRYLFADLIYEEMRRDEAFRHQLQSVASPNGARSGPSIAISSQTFTEDVEKPTGTTPNASDRPPINVDTPGFRIGAATPGVGLTQVSETNGNQSQVADGSAPVRKSAEDYFSVKGTARPSDEQIRDSQPKTPQLGPANGIEVPTSPSDATAVSPAKETSTSFGRRLKSTFTPKKSMKNLSAAEERKTVVDEKESTPEQKLAENPADELPVGNTMLHVLEEIRAQYLKQKEQAVDSKLKPLMTPALPNDAPVLEPPTNTAIIIQDDHPSAGGVTDLFEGYLDQLGRHADYIEKVAPRWLGNLLLKNVVPDQAVTKVSFVLKPYQQLLPIVTAEEGNERLNANRLLRANKVLGYVMERLHKEDLPEAVANAKPEETLELYCQDQIVSPKLTLLTIRTHLWKASGDVVLLYKPKWKAASV